MKYTYHYSYEYIDYCNYFYGDGIASTDHKITSETYNALKESIFNKIDNKEKIGDYKKLHIISLSLI